MYTQTTWMSASLSWPHMRSMKRSVEMRWRGLASSSSIIWNSLLASRKLSVGEDSSKVARFRHMLPMRISEVFWADCVRVMARMRASSSLAAKGLVR